MRRMRVPSTPTYDTPFTRESELWGGRTMLPVRPRHPDIECRHQNKRSPGGMTRKNQSPILSVVSYNVLSDSNTTRVRYCPDSELNWARRRDILLREVFSMRADVLCLQDVNLFHEWWGPQLTNAGYDSLFKQRTSKSARHREGVVIAWKRDVFDLFRSADLELNRLGGDEDNRELARRAATSDNVALMLLLQPLQEGAQECAYPSGACVVCTQLYDEQGPAGDAVRILQTCGLTRSVEAFNSDFHLPVVLCGTMNFVPSSGAYEILCHGVMAIDPAAPGPPGKPFVEPLSTSTARIRWEAPKENNETLGSPVGICSYKVLWVAGGSRFLSGESVDVPAADCLVYDLVDGRSEQNTLRSYAVAGLSSGVAYEFRIAAVNALGRGAWSERSDPVRMHILAEHPPEDRVLLSPESIKALRQRELEEARRRVEIKRVDPRTYELRKLVEVGGQLDLGVEKSHPFHSVSGSTPRYSDAQIHPDSANVRTDMGFPITEPPPSLKEFSTAPTDTTTAQRRHLKATFHDQNECKSNQTLLSAGGARERDELQRLISLKVSGARSGRQRHALGLRSAYMSHGPGGEPSFTTLSNSLSGTSDYIFFSASCLLPVRVLSLPETNSLEGHDIQQTEFDRTPGSWAPAEWQGNPAAEAYTGQWIPYLRENRMRVRQRIPNGHFPSDHVILMAELLYFEPGCPSTWR